MEQSAISSALHSSTQAMQSHVPGVTPHTSDLQAIATVSAQQQQQQPQSPAKKPTKKRVRIQTEKRKEQNRSNQRAFRQRRERYVKDLEVSHQNLRQLVEHQGGEVDTLRKRLVQLSGGVEGTEPPVPHPASSAMHFHADFNAMDSPDGSETTSSDQGEGEEPQLTPISNLTASRQTQVASLPGFHDVHETMEQKPALHIHTPVPEMTFASPIFLNTAANSEAAPITISQEPSTGMSSYWSSSPQLGPDGSPTSTLSSSMVSTIDSLSRPLTPSPYIMVGGDGGYTAPSLQPHPYIALPPASIGDVQGRWQPHATREVKDVSHWLEQSQQAKQFFLPYSTDYESYGEVTMDESGDWMPPSALGFYPGWDTNAPINFNQLFSGVTSDSFPVTASPHQLLGRPLTPFPGFASPGADYCFAAPV